MTTQSVIKATLHVIPKPVRRALRRVPLISRLWGNLQNDSLFHDVFYTASYYQDDVAPPASAAAKAIVAGLIRRFRPKSVLDVGCGTGEYLSELRRAGIEVTGLDLAQFALETCRAKGLRVMPCDLQRAEVLPARADLVYSFEVAEHLPEQCAARFARLLADAADRFVVMTAAIPGQGGLHHFNCQPKAYWVRLVEAQGLIYQPDIVEEWQGENSSAGLPHWFCENLLVFHRPVAAEAAREKRFTTEESVGAPN